MSSGASSRMWMASRVERMIRSTPRRSASSITSAVTGSAPAAPLPTMSRRHSHGRSRPRTAGRGRIVIAGVWRAPSSASARAHHRSPRRDRRPCRRSRSFRSEPTEPHPLRIVRVREDGGSVNGDRISLELEGRGESTHSRGDERRSVKATYWTLGADDLVVITEASDAEAVPAVFLRVGPLGTCRDDACRRSIDGSRSRRCPSGERVPRRGLPVVGRTADSDDRR